MNSFITVLRQLLVLYDRFNMDISVIVSFIGFALLFSISFLIPAGILHELYEIACLLFTGFTFNRVRLFLQTSAEEKFILFRKWFPALLPSSLGLLNVLRYISATSLSSPCRQAIFARVKNCKPSWFRYKK